MTRGEFTGRWRSALGNGPARQACAEAVTQFAVAFEATRVGLHQSGARVTQDTARTHGFSWEGEAAALVLAGASVQLRRRLDVATPVETLFLKLGVGFARCLQGRMPRDPMEADGAGFAEGLLRNRCALDRRVSPHAPPELQSWADQGVGRSVWYVLGGAPVGIVRLLSRFPESRTNALWRGLGVAMVFTGGAELADIQRLLELCPRLHALRRGAAWAHAVQPLPDDLRQLVLPEGSALVELDFERLGIRS